MVLLWQLNYLLLLKQGNIVIIIIIKIIIQEIITHAWSKKSNLRRGQSPNGERRQSCPVFDQVKQAGFTASFKSGEGR